AADLFKSKMESGHKYEYELVIQININNFTFQGNDKIMEEYSLRNEEGETLTEKLRFIYIYLPNIKKKCYNGEKLSVLERLLLTFNEEENLKVITKGDKIMEDYVKEAKDASAKDEVIGLYDK
ncbi:MAG: PD-(D/E)XK nuclease family transposase, partial [Bacilli bacterium]